MLRIVISTMFDDVSLRLITLEHSNTVLIEIPPLLSNLCILLVFLQTISKLIRLCINKKSPVFYYKNFEST